jgi:hypothetical protein
VHLVRDPRPAPLPAAAADLVVFLAAEHGRGISVNTWTSGVRRSAISHFIAGLPVPTAEARVTETMTGIHREAAAKGQAPIQKLTATVDILRQILAPIGDDLIEAARSRPAHHPALLQGRAQRPRRHRRDLYGMTALCPHTRPPPLTGRRGHHGGADFPADLAATLPGAPRRTTPWQVVGGIDQRMCKAGS